MSMTCSEKTQRRQDMPRSQLQVTAGRDLDRLRNARTQLVAINMPNLLLSLTQVLRLSRFSPILLAVLLIPFAAAACDLDGSSLTCKSLDLTEIPENHYEEDIRKFEFVGNSLHNLENNALMEFPTVSSLFLCSNSIFDVGVDAFDGLDKLRTLDLAHNQISKLDPNTFKENTKLTAFSLKDNPVELSPSPFLYSETIDYLDLSECKLTSLETDTLSGLTKLQTLILLHNSLKHLPVDFFDNLPDLQSVYLHGNPWNCDDDLRNLFESKKHLIADYKRLDCKPVDSQPETKNQELQLDANLEKEMLPKALPLRKTEETKPVEDDDSSSESEEDVDDDVAKSEVGDVAVEGSDVIVNEVRNDVIKDDEVKEVILNVIKDDEVKEEILDVFEDDEVKDVILDVIKDDEVKEEILDARSVLVYFNIALIIVIASLAVGVLLIFLRRRGYIGARKPINPVVDEEEDEYNGYMIPRVIPGAPKLVRENEDTYSHHIYERIN